MPSVQLPADILIERATVADAQCLSKFGAKTFADTFRGTCSDADLEQILQDYYNLEQVTQELSDPHDYFFILKSSTSLGTAQVCGYSRLKAGQPPKEFAQYRSIELKRLYLDRAVHGTGLARWLMRWNVEFSRELGFQRLYLSVWEHNERAKNFYRKHGLVDSGLETPYPIGETLQMDYWYYLDLT